MNGYYPKSRSAAKSDEIVVDSGQHTVAQKHERETLMAGGLGKWLDEPLTLDESMVLRYLNESIWT